MGPSVERWQACILETVSLPEAVMQYGLLVHCLFVRLCALPQGLRPGDILTAANGKTIEVRDLNPD